MHTKSNIYILFIDTLSTFWTLVLSSCWLPVAMHNISDLYTVSIFTFGINIPGHLDNYKQIHCLFLQVLILSFD